MQTLRRRLSWYSDRLRVNNAVVGRLVELTGNRVRMDGLTYSVECPQVSTPHKSTLLFGLHEMEEREILKRWLPADVPVLELGGGLGVVSCLVARRLSPSVPHVVIEANPEMLPVLSRNRDLNGCRFTVVNKAIAYDASDVTFAIDGEFVGSSAVGTEADPEKVISVEATTIGRLMEEFSLGEVGIVADIEGGEADIIRRELPALGERVRFFMAEMHPRILGEDVVAGLKRELVALGFSERETIGDTIFYSR